MVKTADNNERGAWKRYEASKSTVEARSIDEIVPALHWVQDAVESNGLTAVGFLSYEAAPAFDPALVTRVPGSCPLLWFSLYEEQNVPIFHSLEQAIDTSKSSPSQPKTRWVPTIGDDSYLGALTRIKQYIEGGETYQVNFSYRLRASISDHSRRFFVALDAAQPSPLATYIETADWAISSVSPELFFQVENGSVEMRPMKGTIGRGQTPEKDRARATELHTSEKDRAENLMIVDMMRSDVGRIARPGTVEVPHLYALEKHPTLWQMSSTVRAETQALPVEILAALFPCASITGAPKVRTMEIIAELESTPRGVYTGAIGTITPGATARFSVAIRTAFHSAGSAMVEYGTGGGIVWDSVSEHELAESKLKTAVLSRRTPTFELLETIRWKKEDGFWLLQEHLSRVTGTAEYFSIPLEPTAVHEALDRAVEEAELNDVRIRLRVAGDGTIHTETGPHKSTEAPWRVTFATEAIDSSNPFLYHKTTHRTPYVRARRAFPDYDDVLLWNEEGYITESTVANLVARLDGELITPPVSCGLLPGTFRERLLRDGTIRERLVHISELSVGSEIYLVNSLRGWIPAQLD